MEVFSGWIERVAGKDVVRLVTGVPEPCPGCGGDGAPDAPHLPCDRCGGSGEIVEKRALKSFAARWSFFLRGVDDEDRKALQRLSGVVAAQEVGEYLRVDCSNRWERRRIAEKVEESIKSAMISSTTRAAVCEADVGPIQRLLADVPALTVSSAHRAFYLDIEVDSRGSIEDQRAGKRRVLSWAGAWLDPRTDETRSVAFALEEDTDAAERVLLERLLRFLVRFDMVLAWFGAVYDFEVITRRCVRLDAKLPGGKVPEWNRWAWLDQAEVFRKYNVSAAGSGDEKASLALGSVAERLLGEGKYDFDAARTWEAWEAGGESRDALLAYCLQDTLLLPRIEAVTRYVALHREVCRICSVIPHTESLRATRQGDGYLLRLGAEHDHRWPTVWYGDDEETTPFEGAFVMDPRPGVYEDVSVCDFAGLYPSIMRSWNMSPETVLAPYEAQARIAAGRPVAKLPARRTVFDAERVGIVPLALDDLQAKRDTYKAEMKQHVPGTEAWKRADALSKAFKIVINSFYGIVGSPFSRFFTVEVAEGVTTTGAWLIKHAAKRAEERGFDPFYGDTDSLFVAGAPLEGFSKLVDDLNEEWPRILADAGAPRCHIDLDFEKRFRRLVLVKAKRYAGALGWYGGRDADPDAPPEVKGLEYKRGDSLRIARRMQEEVIGVLLRPGPLPERAELEAFVERWHQDVVSGDGVALEDFVQSQSFKGFGAYAERYTTAICPKPCGKDFGGTGVGDGPEQCPACGIARKKASFPPHVRVAYAMKERGDDIRAGDRVRYLVIPSEDKSMCAVPVADVGSLSEIDRAYYWTEKVLPPTARVLDVVYPAKNWIPTAREKKAAEKERLREERRGKIDDLPLFGGATGHEEASGRPDAPEPPPLRPASEAAPRAVVVKFGTEATAATIRAVKALADANPGAFPLVLWFGLEAGTRVEMPTGLQVSRSSAFLGTLRELGAEVVPPRG